MKKILLSVAALALLAGSASAQNLVIGFGTGAEGGTAAVAGSSANGGTVTGPIIGFAATGQQNTTVSGANTAVTGLTTLGGSAVAGASNAGTQSTSTGFGFSAGLGASAGGSSGTGAAAGASQGFGFSGLGINLP